MADKKIRLTNVPLQETVDVAYVDILGDGSKYAQAVAVVSGGGGGGAATIADGADVTQGAKADSAANDNTSSWSVISLLKAIYRQYVLAAAATWTRLANTTAYSIGQMMGPSATAGSCPALQFQVAKSSGGGAQVFAFRCFKSGTAITNATFKLSLFSADPGVANGDAGTFVPSTGANYLGSVTVTNWQVCTDGAVAIGIPDNGAVINAILASGQKIYGYQSAGDAYPPISQETFAWAAFALPN